MAEEAVGSRCGACMTEVWL